MPIHSRFSVPIPNVSLTTYLFTSPTHPLPDSPVFLSAPNPSHLLTFRSYRLWCQRLALGLQNAGLQKGDRVLLFSGNTLYFPVIIHGVIMAGGVFTGANPTFVARELAYQLQDSGARFLIAAEGSLEIATEAASAIGFPKQHIFAFDAGEKTAQGTGQPINGIQHWTALLAPPDAGAKFAWEDLKSPEELNRTVALNYSSGTTGVPKGVEITHRNYVSNTIQTLHMGQQDPEYPTKIKRAKWLSFVPMYHAMGQSIFCVSAPLQGIPVYIMPKFDFVKTLTYAQKYQITSLVLVPPVVVALAKRRDIVEKFDLSCVERIGSGAAPLGREVCAEVEKMWKELGWGGEGFNVKQGWGMTEATCSVISWHPLVRSESFSVGELLPNCSARIMAEDGMTEVPQGERGEIWISAPNVMKGYWKKPAATRDTMSDDGWLKTGDIAYVDEKGLFYIVDRKKELIKVKGNQVAPAELEALLLDHAAVGDAAVIGVTVSNNGEELPRAYIVLAEGKAATAEEIQEWFNTKVTRIKRLSGGIKFVDAIPKNPSGKILRKLLRDQAKAEFATPMARL
ncbi:acetyl-CoA synthetase-like protein [Aulographum hederae CBS 113979]|uniref:Acetyl-CoA synthetase-like protein n=1 Tax=Aulographum hederae CBS 113979 TaxID=1176131 RepID=A0A6G1GQN9_9PEZI|nr:acetyl-CoA synthetase-like protein [Aulographum hederae CBS 113979]